MEKKWKHLPLKNKQTGKKEAFSNHKNEVMFSLLAQLCVGNVWMQRNVVPLLE